MTSSVSALADDALYGMLSDSPDIAVILGTSSVAGRELPRGTWPDFSQAGIERRAGLVAQWKARLGALPSSADTPAEAVTRSVLEYILGPGFQNRFSGVAGAALEDHIDPVTHISGVHSVAVEMLVHQSPPADDGSRAIYLERLARLPEALRQARTLLNERRRRGFVAPAVVLQRAADDIAESMNGDVREHLFMRPLLARTAQRTPAHETAIKGAADLITTQILPAYRALFEELQQHIAVGREIVSSLARPRGDAYYAWRFAGHTTTTLRPEEAHRLAQTEIKRVRESLQEEFSQLKFSGSVDENLARWAAEDRPVVNGDARAEVLERMVSNVRATRDATRPLFNLFPRADVVVEQLPLENEGSQHSYYIPPADQGTRPGIFWLNAAQMAAQPCAEADVLCFHEAWPGHHLQLALAQELRQPAFHQAVLFNAYLEGWAKYAEGLPEVIGATRSRYARVARLRSELYSTTTLAVDTGIHVHGWTLEQGRKFFAAQTGSEPGLAQMVVMRSSANPAQLSSYKIGLLKLRELRELFAAQRGARFRIQDFHDSILGRGCLPLAVLERAVAADARAPA